MMGADEAGTLTTLMLHRETVFDPADRGQFAQWLDDPRLSAPQHRPFAARLDESQPADIVLAYEWWGQAAPLHFSTS